MLRGDRTIERDHGEERGILGREPNRPFRRLAGDARRAQKTNAPAAAGGRIGCNRRGWGRHRRRIRRPPQPDSEARRSGDGGNELCGTRSRVASNDPASRRGNGVVTRGSYLEAIVGVAALRPAPATPATRRLDMIQPSTRVPAFVRWASSLAIASAPLGAPAQTPGKIPDPGTYLGSMQLQQQYDRQQQQGREQMQQQQMQRDSQWQGAPQQQQVQQNAAAAQGQAVLLLGGALPLRVALHLLLLHLLATLLL